MNRWLAVRAALVTFCFAYGAISAPEAFGESVPAQDWAALHMMGILFGFGVLGLLFVVGIQVLNPRSAPKWRYPSWSINPFLLKEPLQPFHLIGYAMLAQGIGHLVNGVFRSVVNTDGVVFITFGAGIVAGVHICSLVYRRKMTYGT